MVREVVINVVLIIAVSDALAAEENVFVETGVVRVSIEVGFVEELVKDLLFDSADLPFLRR